MCFHFQTRQGANEKSKLLNAKKAGHAIREDGDFSDAPDDFFFASITTSGTKTSSGHDPNGIIKRQIVAEITAPSYVPD
jgi:hypothetical protein